VSDGVAIDRMSDLDRALARALANAFIVKMKVELRQTEDDDDNVVVRPGDVTKPALMTPACRISSGDDESDSGYDAGNVSTSRGPA
jgi:hypothetical protein